jgi:SAM-dependent methyltransferase
MHQDPTQRFSSRVQYYIRHRPGYPRQIIGWLREMSGLTPQSIVADVGSGTGALGRLFLEAGNRVYGVEPNQEMREAGEELLSSFPRFVSINGTAEQTTLASHSVDFISVGQAFHWFDRQVAYQEFHRVLKESGWTVLVWNDRQTDSTPFLRDYEHLLRRYATEYTRVTHKRFGLAELRDLVGRDVLHRTFDNCQRLSFEGLKGRLLSSSYVPLPGQPNYKDMLTALSRLFQDHQQNDRVNLRYTTQVFLWQRT